MTTKRIFELEIGDVFRIFGQVFIVNKIKDGRLYYRYENGNSHGVADNSFGAKSSQIVEIIKKAA